MGDTQSALEIIARLSLLKIGDFRGKMQIVPDEIKSNVDVLVGFFQNADADSRTSLTAQVKPSFAFVFLWYAKEKSIEAVRTNEPNLIFEGLVALAIENGTFDVRESIVVMALLYNSSLKLGTDSRELFRRAANLAQNKVLAGELVKFPGRSEEARNIRAFNFSESGSGTDFTYVGRG
jgi:hypothetical protein